MLNTTRLPTRLLKRKPSAHKGDFGHIFIAAGSARYSGAAVLCAYAAMRSGAGLVTLGIPESLNNPIIKIKPPEVMILPLPETREKTLSLNGYKKITDFIKNIDVVALGPGLSRNHSTQLLIRKIIANIKKPLVLDADGLNALAGNLKLLPEIKQKNEKNPVVLTPHPKEMERLIGSKIKNTQKDRKEVAKSFVKKYNVTLVLKGHNTLIAGHSGKIYINNTGNPGMSTAGSGDVLTGMIAAFLAQGLEGFEASKYAVMLHGTAGDIAAEEKTQISLIASDIIDKIPDAIKRYS